MSIDPRVLKRLLTLRLLIEGPSSWTFRELVDVVLDFFNERFALILNEVLEPYKLEASVLKKSGCELAPNIPNCDKLLVVGVYEKELDKPLAYALYYLDRGENTLELHLHSIVDAETLKEITSLEAPEEGYSEQTR